MKSEATVYVSLAPGKCAEVVVRIVEEGLPSPHEACAIREPSVSEMDEVVNQLWAEYDTVPPFEIIRPTWQKPVHGKLPPVVPQPAPTGETIHSRRTETGRPWWMKLLSR